MGKRPIDVQVAERLGFGQPIIRFLPVTSVSIGADPVIVIRGSNFTPVIPFNALTVTVGGVPAIFVSGDNLAGIRIKLGPDIRPQIARISQDGARSWCST